MCTTSLGPFFRRTSRSPFFFCPPLCAQKALGVLRSPRTPAPGLSAKLTSVTHLRVHAAALVAHLHGAGQDGVPGGAGVTLPEHCNRSNTITSGRATSPADYRPRAQRHHRAFKHERPSFIFDRLPVHIKALPNCYGSLGEASALPQGPGEGSCSSARLDRAEPRTRPNRLAE